MKVEMKKMILHGLSGFTIIGVLVCFLHVTAVSQAAIEITTTDGISTAVDTFGISVYGTYCIDGCLDGWFQPQFCEAELSPLNPSIFDVRFVESRAGSSCLGAGVRVHLQQGDPIKPDTFWLSINQPDTNAYPISISWRILEYPYGLIDADILFNSMWMADTGEGLFSPVNMRSDSITTISDRRISLLQIITTTDLWVDVNEDSTLPNSFSLLQNYPNPFNPGTTISYSLAGPDVVELSIYDNLGRRISILDQGRRSVGVHKVHFDATELPGGIYHARLVTRSNSQSLKLLYLK